MKPTCYIFQPQGSFTYDELRATAMMAESLGYDGFWLVDHMWPRDLPDVDFLESWTAIAGLAEATSSLRLGVLVTCNGYRNPGMLAKAVVTADHISKGRVELGIGAGWMEEEYRAYGYDFPPIGTRLSQLGESLEIVTRLLTSERTNFQGKHYSFIDAPFRPKPLQTPLPITIGGGGTKVLMRLVARYAHRWNCPMNRVAELGEHIDALRRYCDELGRDADDIVISEQVPVVLGRDAAHYRSKRALAQKLVGGFVGDIDAVGVCGTPDVVAAGLRAKQRAGVRDFALLFGDLAMPDTLELFVREVLPALA